MNRTFNSENTPASKIELWWKYKLDKQNGKMPGFSVEWTTKDAKGNDIKESYGIKDILFEDKKFLIYQNVEHQLNYLTKSLKYRFVSKAKKGNMTNSAIWNLVIKHKEKLAAANSIECSSGLLDPVYYNRVFETLPSLLPNNLPKVPYRETSDDLIFTFDIFSYLMLCSKEANEVYSFYNNLLTTGSVPTILQATMNNLKSKSIKKTSTTYAVQQIYEKLSKMLNFTLPTILSALSNSENFDNSAKYGNMLVSKTLLQDNVNIGECSS